MVGNRPVKTYRLSHISASVFRNDVTAQGGTGTRPLFSVQLQKRSRDDDGNWRTVPIFNLPDVPLVQRVLAQAQDFMDQQESPDGD